MPPNFRLLALGAIALVPITAWLDVNVLGLPLGMKYYAVATAFEYSSAIMGFALGIIITRTEVMTWERTSAQE